MRVLLLSPLPPPAGGIATWTKILLKEIQNHPDIEIQHIDIAVRWKKDINCSQFLRLTGGSFQALRDILRVAFSIVSFRPHVLHLTTSGGYASLKDVLTMLLARLFGIAGLIHYRTSRVAGYQYTGKWALRAALLAMRLASVVVVLDQRTYDFLQKLIPASRLKKIPNMIDVERIDRMIAPQSFVSCGQPKTERVRVVFVGRVVQEKGVMEQVEACAQLENVHLHLIGSVYSKFRNKLENIAQRRDGGHWLHFYGQVDNDEARRQIMLSDILLLPSYYEAFPNVVLEGMAQAKPVVVSDVGAMPEMVDANGENPCGVCVKPGDTQSLLFGLKGLLGRPEGCKDMGHRARKRVETLYSSSVVIKQLEKEWREMTISHGRLPCG